MDGDLLGLSLSENRSRSNILPPGESCSPSVLNDRTKFCFHLRGGRLVRDGGLLPVNKIQLFDNFPVSILPQIMFQCERYQTATADPEFSSRPIRFLQ